MSRTEIAKGQKPDGTYGSIQLDSAGNLKTTAGASAPATTVVITDGSVNATITNVSGKQSLDVNVTDVTISHANDSIRLGDGTNLTSVSASGALKVDASATTQPVSASSLPLPSGAATSANQTTGNTSLNSIDTKTPSLGQAAMAASSPVVIANNQSAIPISNSDLFPPKYLSGTVGALADIVMDISEGYNSVRFMVGSVNNSTWNGGGSFLISGDGVNYFPVAVTNENLLDGQVPVSFAAPAHGTQIIFSINVTGAKKFKVANLNGSGTASIVYSITATRYPGPTPQVQSVSYTKDFEWLIGAANTANAKAVTPATDSAPFPISASSLPLPTGSATAANQTTGNTTLSSIDTKLTSQATSANQTTGNASLSSIDTKLTSQATAANQTTGNSSLSSIDTKLTSQATSANQTTGNASLTSIDSKITAMNSSATVISSSALPTNAAKETAGNLDLHSMLLELIVLELRRHNFLISTAFGLDPGAVIGSDFSSQQTLQ